MKLVKLSLVAALAAGAFSAANAVSLEEAIKDVDVSGMFRYRFESDRLTIDDQIQDRGYNSSKNNQHKFKSQLNFKAALDDNFKAFVQFQYKSTDNGFGRTTYNPIGGNLGTDTDSTFNVQQAYLEYTNEAYATSVMLGKMEVDSIWTDDAVGTGARITNNSIDGLTFAGFWFDALNWNDDGDFGPTKINKSSLYGAAVLGEFDPFAFQLWAAYSQSNMFLYAVDASYSFAFDDSMKFKAEAQYLGNSLDSDFKNFYKNSQGSETVKNGNFYAGKISADISAFDLQAGVVGYGDKNKGTLVTIEDTGRVIAPGKQIFYSEGSKLTGDGGKNFFYFAGVGYTFAEKLRLGFDYVGGTTKIETQDIDKNEYLGSISYAYSPKLTFSGFYSYLTEDQGAIDKDDQYIRLEALYKF